MKKSPPLGRRAALSILVSATVALALPRRAEADEVKDLLESIAKARAPMKSLVATFTQERTIGLLATTVKSEGKMTLVTPNRLRWELLPPDAITYFIGPDGFAFVTPQSTAHVGKSAAGRFGAVLGDMLILLGGDLEKLRERYDLSVERGESGVSLVARPKVEEVRKHVRRIEMRTGKELWTAQRVVIEEAGGDRSVITFRDVVRDAAVDPKMMVPPAG